VGGKKIERKGEGETYVKHWQRMKTSMGGRREAGGSLELGPRRKGSKAVGSGDERRNEAKRSVLVLS